MKIRELFKDYQTLDLSETINLMPDWDKIKTIPEFAALEITHQNTDFHKEGNVWEHTKLVGEAMYDILNERKKYKYKHNLHFSADYIPVANMCLVAAAICHDLGKAGHTKFDEKDQQWHCRRHGFHGEQIVRNLFYDENPLVRETVCALVKSHMMFHHLLDEGKEDKVADKLISLSWSNVPISMHILIHLADLHGTINDDTTPEKIRKHLNDILRVCYRYNVPFDYQYQFTQLKFILTRYRIFLNGGESIPEEVLTSDIGKPVLHMMVGLPGSGKDTYIRDVMKAYDEPEKYTVLCRDDIREEIGITKPGEKKSCSKTEEEKVNMIFNDRLTKAISEKKDIIVNNTNLPNKYRESYLVPALTGGYKSIYHIIEAPDMRELISRRSGQISLKAIRSMIETFEFPTLRETAKIIIHKQMFDENNNIIIKDYTITNYLPTNEDFLES